MKTPLLFFAGLLLLAGCSRAPAVKSPPPPPAVAVRTATVEKSTGAGTQEVAGTIRPFDRAMVSARVNGAVADSRLVVGQVVPAGEVLLTLRADELQAGVDSAQAALNQAERDYRRESGLAAKGAATDEAMRAASDRRDQARAALTAAATLLGYTRVAAPFRGVITQEFVKPGDFATAGAPLFALDGLDHMRAEAGVPENLPQLPVGSRVTVVWADQRAGGTLVEISPALDPVTRTRLAKVGLPANTDVQPGQFVRLLWPAGAAVRLQIPAAAVRLNGQMEQSFAVVNGRAQLRLIRTGGRRDGLVEILAGLDAGETVVINPPAGLHDGDPVTVAP